MFPGWLLFFGIQFLRSGDLKLAEIGFFPLLYGLLSALMYLFATIGWAGHLFSDGEQPEALAKLTIAIEEAFLVWNAQPGRGWRFVDGQWTNGTKQEFRRNPWGQLWAALQPEWAGREREGAIPWADKLNGEVEALRERMAGGGA
jgi:hypothetical protein